MPPPPISLYSQLLCPFSERAKIQGWLSSVWGISAILGPAIGGALVDYATWRWIFLINIPIGTAAITLVVMFFHEHKPSKSHRIDWKGAFFMMVSGTAIMFVLLQSGETWAWLSYHTLAFSLLAVIALAITFYLETRSKEPILPGWIWKNRVILGANLATIGFGIAMMGPNMFLPVFAQSVTGLGAMAAGFILASMSITWPLFSALSGNLYLRIGFRNTALCGVAVVVLTAASFSFVPFPGPVWALLAIQMLLGAGFGLMSTPLLVGVQSLVHWEQRGVATGTVIFSRYFGQSLGAALFGAVFNSTLSSKIASAPPNLQAKLPSVNKVLEVLQTHQSLPAIGDSLRHMFFEATQHVYSAVLVVALLAFAVLLRTPANFPNPKTSPQKSTEGTSSGRL